MIPIIVHETRALQTVELIVSVKAIVPIIGLDSNIAYIFLLST